MSTVHITLSFIFLFMIYFRNMSAVPTRHICRPEQRDALLEFKNEFEIRMGSTYLVYLNGTPITYPKTESWENNKDCCYWDGVTCDAKSGEVTKLDLSHSCLYGQFHSNTSLFRFENFPSLKTLDLSHNSFYGKIPLSIGKLSHITSLDLSDNDLSGKILSSVQNLSHLILLDLSGNHFWGHIPSTIGNLSFLTFLDLSDNEFLGQIPSSIGKMSNLKYLDLNNNSFNGEVPSSFGNLNQLITLHVDSNNISGNFPVALLNLTNLSDLLLSFNQFTGKLPPNISVLSKLRYFYASDNSFTGTLPSSLFHIPSLLDIYLENNQLNGSLEFGNISSPSKLDALSLSNNNFRELIPKSISKLVNLRSLSLSHLTTLDLIDLSIFSHLKSLDFMDLSGTHVSTTQKKSVSDPLGKLIDVTLSGCGLTEFPALLRTQKQLQTLDISNNKIKGHVPGWLWTLPGLKYVNLSNNTFVSFQRSTEHVISSAMENLFGSKNNFSGKIPSFICEFRSLQNLDLSNNYFNGSIPLCLGNLKSTLSVLNLRQNRLSGGIPENAFKSLRSLDIGHNQLAGKLPRSLAHFFTLEVLNVESNKINDTFPFWLSSLQELKILVLRNNSFHGPILHASFFTLKIIDISHNHFNGNLPADYFVNWGNMSSLGANENGSTANYMGEGYYQDSMVLMIKGIEIKLERILTIYTALDFSGNKLEGEIPKSIGLLKELHVLNLSNNAFTGHIPSSMGNLTALESLDVSQNKLSGKIPQELGNLSFLAYMNFSHNQLMGLVPGGNQFRRQPCSSFQNNSGLFGPALDEDCKDIHMSPPQESETPEPDEDDEEVFSWIAAAIGSVPGIAFGMAIGYILVSYKPEWFMSLFGRKKRRSRSTTTH